MLTFFRWNNLSRGAIVKRMMYTLHLQLVQILVSWVSKSNVCYTTCFHQISFDFSNSWPELNFCLALSVMFTSALKSCLGVSHVFSRVATGVWNARIAPATARTKFENGEILITILSVPIELARTRGISREVCCQVADVSFVQGCGAESARIIEEKEEARVVVSRAQGPESKADNINEMNQSLNALLDQ